MFDQWRYEENYPAYLIMHFAVIRFGVKRIYNIEREHQPINPDLNIRLNTWTNIRIPVGLFTGNEFLSIGKEDVIPSRSPEDLLIFGYRHSTSQGPTNFSCSSLFFRDLIFGTFVISAPHPSIKKKTTSTMGMLE